MGTSKLHQEERQAVTSCSLLTSLASMSHVAKVSISLELMIQTLNSGVHMMMEDTDQATSAS